MKKFGITLLSLLSTFPVWADLNLEPLLNKVTLTLQSEQWITTKTALVTVGVNAVVTDQGIEKIQTNILVKLNQLADKSDWHILAFNRQLDKSGLENVQIQAQARLPQTALTDLRSKAKALSKPGETYTIDNVQFSPSDDETRQANTSLRNNIYQQAQAEIDTLNKLYPTQKYYLHEIDFSTNYPVRPMPMEMSAQAMAKLAGSSPLAVGDKAQLQANVVIAAMPEAVAQKIVSNQN